MNGQLLEIIRCPQDNTMLQEAGHDLVAQLNAAISQGRLSNHAGESLSSPIVAGLVRVTGDILYPVVDGIPLLLRDEAIELDQLGSLTA
jgi:uncharacterized protein YbaR (Trm112 family)